MAKFPRKAKDVVARLGDDCVVVRGGQPTARGLHDAADHTDDGHFGFSACSAPDLTAGALARARPIPHGRIAVTTVGTIRRLGFDVVRTGAFPHVTVLIPEDADAADLESLAAAFQVERNPARP